MTDSKLGPGIISGLEELVGGTPMVRLRLPDVPDHVRLLAKVEMLNPLASVKDRAALWMLRDAERTGKLPLDGVTKFLKERRSIHTVAVDPTGSPVLSGGERGPHKIPGMGGGFINPVTDVDCIDQVITVADEDAADSAKELTRSLGLFVGVSSGAAVHAARVLAASGRWAGATIVTVLPDSGERYLSIWESLGTQGQQARAA